VGVDRFFSKENRARTSDRDLFIKRLAKISGAEGGFVSNEALRAELRWEKPKYKAIHGSLRQEEKVVVKRGRGGLVAMAGTNKAERMKVFVSYSHVDKDLKDRLIKHIRPLENENLVQVWVDHEIKAGDDDCSILFCDWPCAVRWTMAPPTSCATRLL
jgi:hypothetical protein